MEGGAATVHYGARSAIGLQEATGLTPTGLLVIGSDDVAGDTSTTRTLTVGGPDVVSTIETIGDLDFFRVELVADRAYEFGMFAEAGGPGGVPLIDSLIEIRDAAGNLITSADGGASTQLNVINSGFDAILSFTPTASGTYYISARAFDNVPEDGTNGDMVGDYRLTATDVTDLPRYIPYYDADSPLYALDWGSQVDGTVRNPDGEEVGRSTDNPEEAADTKGATTGYFGGSTEGKNVIKIYFAKVGDVYTPEDVTQPGLPPAAVAVGATDFEYNAVWTALREFEKVADVVYVETQSREDADFHYVTYKGTPGPGVSLLGSMAPPGETDEGLALFNSGDERWNAQNLAQGGFSFVTLIHEFGHGHGMAHPHDNGGRSGVMRGVTADGPVADYTTGDFSLNQGVFTMMSYQDGWQESPYGNAETDVGYGYLGGLMAFDIAVIQDKYGINEEWATGDDTYRMKDENAAGTYYYSIWDAGGTDQIVYDGAKNATIDLRAATLKYELGGGGNVSYATGIFGGFTIANGVLIENIRSGAGNDTLTGNDASNRIEGGLGSDKIDGGGGFDTTVFFGGFRQSSFSAANNEAIVVGVEGIDTVKNVERLQFLDGVYSFGVDTQGAKLQRLYDAVLDRAPDQQGLEHWLDKMNDGGVSLVAVADYFLRSPEFQASGSNVSSNAAFVDHMYRYVLEREADAAGRADWVARLDGGLSRADTLVFFSESEEHKALSAETTGRGYFETDDAYQTVALMYDSFLGRAPDAAGASVWAESFKSGTLTLAQLGDGFAGSAEFQTRTAGMSQAQLIEYMYATTLDRSAAASEQSYWLGELSKGMSVNAMLTYFAISPEHQQLLEAKLVGGIELL